MKGQINNDPFESPQAHSNQQKNAIKEIFEMQRQAYLNSPFPEEKLRKQQLTALKKSLLKHKDRLVKAISADFGCRSADESLLADILTTVMCIDHALKHLRDWMQPQSRSVSLIFQPAKARIMYQPLGVVGIMAPWNYPIYLTLGPLVGAIAAGNRVMIKPSEFCPYTNRILKQILADAFSKDEVCLIEGDAQVSAEFSQIPFDHILFTGSTNIGKKVMAAAAQNLTPVTLELGGKSPAIIAKDVSADFAVERILYGKCLNAGQTCVAPDYILCPEDKIEDLIESFKSRFTQLYPNVGNGDYTSVINEQQYQRLQSWLDDAVDKGAQVIPLSEPSKSKIRSMPLQLLTNVNHTMKVMQEEIFGPILPIIGYNSLKQALKMIHSQPRPLALYLFTHNKKLKNHILHETHSGGVCVNDTVAHFAQVDLPIGGIGASGMGIYHAQEGFSTFSQAKPIFKRGKINSAKMAFPPYNKLIHRFIYRWFLS